MGSKKILFLGIVLLILGILLRRFASYESIGLFLILTGVFFKTIYIIAKTKSGEYQPGREMIFLGLGLMLFLSGLILRSLHSEATYPFIMIVSGLILKVVFVVLFIRKVKKNGRNSEDKLQSDS